MKIKYSKLFISVISAFSLMACNDDFMERFPEDTISEKTFWSNENDLKNYVNAFYPAFVTGFGSGSAAANIAPKGINAATTPYGDVFSDNAVKTSYNSYFANQDIGYKSASNGNALGMDYGHIRRANYFLANYKKAAITDQQKSKYVAEVRFFRAWDYFEKVKLYGDIQWISKPLETNSPELYSARVPREIVMDSIIANIDEAIANLPEKGSEETNRINKQMALFLKARVGLYEGTFRKYQNTGLDANKYLRYAVDASEKIMNGGKHSLQTTGDKNTIYNSLFAQTSYRTNPEAILWREYSTALNVGSDFSRYFAQNNRYGGMGATRSLVDSYLCTDGKSISASPLFKGKNTIGNEMTNRDPRLTQSVANFGTYNLAVGISQGAENAPKPNLPGLTGTNKCVTGYRICKWFYNNPTDWAAITNGQQAGLMWRYAEVLLNYAEAKYELGEISQGVVDQTINKLRARVGMPNLLMGSETADAAQDQLDAQYLGYSIAPILREIRRERRVELAFENSRWDDLVRWKAGRYLDAPILGLHFNQTDFPTLKVGSDILVDSEGFITPFARTLPTGYKFEDKFYLFPYANGELLLNPALKQNPGW